MSTYNIPRNVKGEGRILFIFSKKAMIYTTIGAGIGFFIYFILSLIKLDFIGYIVIGVLGFLGFAIGTFKMPNSNVFSITKATGGENIDDVIMRFIKFKKNKNKIYVYMEENTKDEGGNEDD